MIDVVHEINAVRRHVGSRMLDAGEARTVTVGRTYDAPMEDVWDACTNPERIQRWFLPVSGDPRVGGRYQLQGNAAGTIERCDPPNSFAATWEVGGDVTWIELRLSREADGGLVSSWSTSRTSTTNGWAQFGPGAAGVGWDLGLLGLAMHVESGKSRDPQERRVGRVGRGQAVHVAEQPEVRATPALRPAPTELRRRLRQTEPRQPTPRPSPTRRPRPDVHAQRFMRTANGDQAPSSEAGFSTSPPGSYRPTAIDSSPSRRKFLVRK